MCLAERALYRVLWRGNERATTELVCGATVNAPEVLWVPELAMRSGLWTTGGVHWLLRDLVESFWIVMAPTVPTASMQPIRTQLFSEPQQDQRQPQRQEQGQQPLQQQPDGSTKQRGAQAQFSASSVTSGGTISSSSSSSSLEPAKKRAAFRVSGEEPPHAPSSTGRTSLRRMHTASATCTKGDCGNAGRDRSSSSGGGCRSAGKQQVSSATAAQSLRPAASAPQLGRGLPPSPQEQKIALPSSPTLSLLVAAKTLVVRESCELSSSVVEPSVSLGQLVIILQTSLLEDGTKRALVVRKGQSVPIGWVTYMHRDGAINLVPRTYGALLEQDLAKAKARAAAERTTAIVADRLAEAAARCTVFTGSTMPLSELQPARGLRSTASTRSTTSTTSLRSDLRSELRGETTGSVRFQQLEHSSSS